MQTAINCDLYVLNGDIGQVTMISPGRKKDSFRIVVASEIRAVEYIATDAVQIILAYPISVHKSDGRN